jgi:parallel beta-helix repeat protein
MNLSWLIACSLFLTGCPGAPKEDYEIVQIKQPNAVIDCNGKEYNKGKITELRILASGVTVRRCQINGAVRIVGMGVNGEAEAVRQSSLMVGHTVRAQAVAPTNTSLWRLTITGYGRIPLYIAPGVTNTTLADSTIKGKSNSVALYLDAESGNNIIRNNTFDVDGQFTLRQFRVREVIAVDGSADNQLLSNIINNAKGGGVYLYRNCGEGGTVRHQTPQRNFIAGNTIDNTGGYGIWLGSRNGNRFYCEHDAGFPFGSSQDNGDFADNNIVRDNVFSDSARAVRNDGNNSID